MTVSLEDVMKKFTPEQRLQVQARTAELIRAEGNFATTQVKERPRGRLD
jgi:hypothetical protein